jgi:hypothetical protein
MGRFTLRNQYKIWRNVSLLVPLPVEFFSTHGGKRENNGGKKVKYGGKNKIMAGKLKIMAGTPINNR